MDTPAAEPAAAGKEHRRADGGSHGRPPHPPQPPVAPGGSLAVGVDLVDVRQFAEQLETPGTVFAERSFTPRERREARRRAASKGSREAEHLAGRWAAKEAFIKAWSQAIVARGALTGAPTAPVMKAEEVDWRSIELVSDRWGRPRMQISGEIARAVEASLGRGAAGHLRWPVSVSHDGDWAVAIVLHAPAPSTHPDTRTRHE